MSSSISKLLISLRSVRHNQTKKSFPDALKNIMEARSLSYARLAEATKAVDPTGKGLSQGYLHNLASGLKKPTPQNMEVIADATGVDRTFFKEYREYSAAQAAKALSARIGYDEVMAALEALERPPDNDS